MKSMYVLMAGAVFALVSSVAAQDSQTQIDGFPKTISFDSSRTKYNLGLTGTSTRKKFFVKIYNIGSYLQDYTPGSKQDILADIMQDSKAKQLTIKWVHDVSFAKVQEGYIESFNNNLGAASFNQIQNQINEFVLTFNTNVTKGDVHILRWTPGGNVEVIINDRVLTRIRNLEFAKALWGIWFGDKSVVDKSKLISG